MYKVESGTTYHDSEVGDETTEDSKGRPDLPAHNKATTHASRHDFG
jgi:hypothetical protein